MALMIGTGPLAPERAGVFNGAVSVSGRALYLEPWPRRVRGIFAGEVLVDSRAARLLHEAGSLPQWYFPIGHVRRDLLEPTSQRTRCSVKGEARWFSLRAGGRVFDSAGWSHDKPSPLGPDLSGYIAFHFWALDDWWEEEERVLGHPKDPYHRVDALRSSREVVVSHEGEELAKSERAVVVYETGLMTRHYLPPDDVRTDLLMPSATTTYCPYKGEASYWSRPTGDDLAWSYGEPLPEAASLTGLIAFFDEHVDIELDGELQPRPRTPWGSGG